ncbi:hypothetical protein [Chamaesiphon sp.]|uniref:hypothetical protein n=1 Tax=Chamaesiphon sp. TaxID=2814140 RepID=UPI00359328A9
MKRMKVTMLLAVAIACLGANAAQAEAPTPRGGCWSREIAVRPPAEQPPVTKLVGRVVAIEHNDKHQPIAAKERVTWARVRTNEGAEKSVYLGSERYLQQQRLDIKVNDVVVVEGVQTLKSQQLPTIAAKTIKKGDRIWKVNQLAAKPTGTKWCRSTG